MPTESKTNKEQPEQIVGIIKQVIFTGDDDYAIISVKPKQGSAFTALGTVRQPSKNAGIVLYGNFVWARGEKQFKIIESMCVIDHEKIAARSFLSTLNMIGETKAEAITDLLGSDVEAIFEHPSCLLEIKGINNSTLEKIKKSYKEKQCLWSIYKVAAGDGDLTENQAKSIYKKYGDKSAEILKKHPYQLIKNLKNFGFLKTDKIAEKCGIKKDDPERIKAAIKYVISEETNQNGHCFLYESGLTDKCMELLYPLKFIRNTYYEDVLDTKAPTNRIAFLETSLGAMMHNSERAFKNMLDAWDNEKAVERYMKKYDLSTEEQQAVTVYLNNRIKFNNLIKNTLEDGAVDMSGLDLIDIETKMHLPEYEDAWFIKSKDEFGCSTFYEKEIYALEIRVAQLFIGITNDPYNVVKLNEETIRQRISEIERSRGYTFGEEQINAVVTSVLYRCTVITGGPGRGKTATIELVADFWESQGNDYKVIMLAPTGRASQRMKESTGHEAKTIHRHILTDAHIKGNKKTMFIVDESSMIDLTLAEKLLDAVGDGRLVLVGDVNQLPCVGIGKFFEDVICSSIIPCTRLIKCYRNSGSISQNADIINNGGKPEDLIKDNMTKIAYLETAIDVRDTIPIIYKKALETYDPSEICILTPMRKRGVSCVDSLNKLIQSKFNPPKKDSNEFKIRDGMVLRVNDRVIYTRNNYNIECMLPKTDGWMEPSLGIFNGETGMVAEIKGEYIKVVFDDGKTSWLNKESARDLDLAYAITIHKSQGSEYKCLILALTTSDFKLLKSRLFYTGESRARTILYLIGMKKAFWRAMTTQDDDNRNTTLVYWLRKMNI